MKIVRAVIGIGVLVATVTAVAGAWAYMQWYAPVVAGTIVDKQERIIGGRHAAPGRYLSTSFKLQNETEDDRYLYGSPTVTDIGVDVQTFTAAKVGAAVNVKYLPFNPRMARLTTQPVVPRAVLMFAAAVILALGSLLMKRTRGAVATCCGLTAAVLLPTPGPPSAQVALIAMGAVAVLAVVAAVMRRGSTRVLVAIWVLAMVAATAWPALQQARSSTLTATADIREVREFRTPNNSRSRYAMTTLQEFSRVHASFVPSGAARPVFMLDFVDRDSVTLSAGSRATVVYDAGNPERARLQEGTRTHYWKNAVVPVGAMLAFGWLLTRSRQSKGRTSRPSSQPA
jgi:hypothetical protein